MCVLFITNATKQHCRRDEAQNQGTGHTLTEGPGQEAPLWSLPTSEASAPLACSRMAFRRQVEPGLLTVQGVSGKQGSSASHVCVCVMVPSGRGFPRLKNKRNEVKEAG